MKRIVIVILVLSLMVSGCTFAKPEESGPPTAQTEERNPSVPTQTNPSGPPAAPTLMDNAETIGQLGNLCYLPNGEIEQMPAPEMRLFGNGLLLWSNGIGDNGCSTVFKLISLENGELLSERTLPSSGFVTVQTTEDRIGICDAGEGMVYIFDSTLGEIQRYTLQSSSENWYLSGDLKTLYQIDWEKGVFARDLATEVTGSILENATNIYVRNQAENYLVLSYTDLSSQRTTCRILNLQTGLLERLPVDSDVISAVFTDNVWVLGDAIEWGTYYVIVNGQRKTALWQENRFDLLLPQCHLLTVAGNGRDMSLYDADGSFVSACEVPEDQALYIGTGLVWSDLWNGYFLLGIQENQTGKLLFWDVQTAVSGEDFPLQEEKTQGGVSADAALYDRAKEIGDRFGVEILIADQCSLTYNLFSAYEVNDQAYITQALDIMEKALSRYPEGYFEQLKFGNIQTISFELIGGLHANDDSVYGGSYAGVTLEQPACYTVVLDIYSLTENNVYHEVTHMTDGKLAWDAALRDDALFSEEDWNKLLPEGFVYAETYQDLSGSSIWQYVNAGYFVNDYACRYPTEDRATMVEMAMMDNDFIYDSNPHLRDKLSYYSECIRDCFNTDGWPEVTAWESILNR